MPKSIDTRLVGLCAALSIFAGASPALAHSDLYYYSNTTWTAPYSTYYTFILAGAQGGGFNDAQSNPLYAGGLGALTSFSFQFAAGSTLNFAVGQTGDAGYGNAPSVGFVGRAGAGGGGGGSTGIYDMSGVFAVAGGGGGAGSGAAGLDGRSARSGGYGGGGSGSGGIDGQGGGGGALEPATYLYASGANSGAGGAGILGNGGGSPTADGYFAQGGQRDWGGRACLNADCAIGHNVYSNLWGGDGIAGGGAGGYGGGGGGGGGWSGGGGGSVYVRLDVPGYAVFGRPGGGGGSYNAYGQTVFGGVNTGSGFVRVIYDYTPPPPPVPEPSTWAMLLVGVAGIGAGLRRRGRRGGASATV